MNFGLVIVGDEILSGRRQDKHFAKIIGLLQERGLQLAWAQILGDDFDALVDNFRRTLASDDVVLCTGGIGATPDDLTRQAMAAALDQPLKIHPEGEQILLDRGNGDVSPHQLRMVTFPENAELIPNPINRVPGFSVQQHYCVPGFPNMAWPMLEWVLDKYYLTESKSKHVEYACHVFGSHEGMLIPLMEDIEEKFPGVKIFCLPDTDTPKLLELGVKGVSTDVLAAKDYLLAELKARALEVTNK